jgi:hypothetical protein
MLPRTRLAQKRAVYAKYRSITEAKRRKSIGGMVNLCVPKQILTGGTRKFKIARERPTLTQADADQVTKVCIIEKDRS